MKYKPIPIKVATNLPDPPELTDDDLRRIDAEATLCRDSVLKGTASLEVLTSEDLRIVIR